LANLGHASGQVVCEEGNLMKDQENEEEIETEEKSKTVKIRYTNIDGVISKRLELKDYLTSVRPDIVCLTETKLNKVIEMNFEGYNIWKRDRKEKQGGGVLIMVRKYMKVDSVEYGKNRAEIVSVRIKFQSGESQTIIVTYVPPKTSAWRVTEYKEMLKDTIGSLEEMMRSNKKVILMGDFNCGEVDWENLDTHGSEDSWGSIFLQMTLDNMLKQWVTEHTRYRGDDEPARLDLVFTKEPQEIKLNYKSPVGKSDHVLLELDTMLELAEKWDEAYKTGRLNYAKTNFEDLKNFYKAICWEQMEEAPSVQEKYNRFLDIYKEGVEKFVPVFRVREKRIKAWFNDRCEKAKRERDKAWNRLKKRRNENTKNEYKRLRNEYVKVRREEERKFEKDIVDKCKEEPKLFYRFINEKTKHKERVTKLKRNGILYEEEEEISELLNNSFQSVFTNETEFEEPRVRHEVMKMKEITVEVAEIEKYLKELECRKATGPDEVSGWVLKECREYLTKPLHHIISSSINSGEVPLEWKRANIVPLFKSGNKEDPLNYRPVSLTSIVCKICEKVIKDHWYRYMEEKEMLSEKQFGFRKGRSCVTNLLSYYSRVTDIVQERDGWVDCVYLDLKKAFDKVPHKRLLWKLNNMGGVSGALLKWMENYLQGREMRTVVRDVKSSWKKVTSGVPQGSVLAPLMFLVYINDMGNGLQSYISFFADDAKLMKEIKTWEDCADLQKDLDKIYEWSLLWKMEFNTKKCHVLEVGKSKKRPTWTYELGKETITKSKEEKDLGVTIQDTLSPEKHIDRIFGNTYSMLVNIKVAFTYMDGDMMRKIISTLIRPKLEYAGNVWSPHMKKHIKKLERVQRAATRMVPELSDLEYEERLKKINLPKLEERRERGDLIMIYKLINEIEEVDTSDMIQRVNEDYGNTRGHSCKLRKPRCRSDVKKYSFPARSIDVWNQLKDEVVRAGSVSSFKEKLDKTRYRDRTPRV